jgi:hypothetical protein
MSYVHVDAAEKLVLLESSTPTSCESSVDTFPLSATVYELFALFYDILDL